MAFLPNVDALMAATQGTYADMLDLAETVIDAVVTGEADMATVRAFRRRLNAAQPYPLASAVTLAAGFLAVAAVQLTEGSDGETPADVLADWRRQAALAVDRAEANLTGGQP